MKKKILIVLALFVVALAMGTVLDTSRYGWSTPQDANDTDDTLLNAAADTMKYAYINVDDAYKPNTRQNAIEICWTMGADAQSCVAYVFAARRNGDVVLVWNGTLTAVKQESTDSRYYVDTIASTTDNWITTVNEVDVGGSDRMSRIVFDTCGYSHFLCEYTGLSSESVKAYFSGY